MAIATSRPSMRFPARSVLLTFRAPPGRPKQMKGEIMDEAKARGRFSPLLGISAEGFEDLPLLPAGSRCG